MSVDDKLAKLKATAASQLSECGVSNIDDARLDTLIGRMRTIVDNKDATLVSGTDPDELATVQRNFVAKKLGVDDKEKGMAAINKAAEQMSGIKFKNRAAFYYLVEDNM